MHHILYITISALMWWQWTHHGAEAHKVQREEILVRCDWSAEPTSPTHLKEQQSNRCGEHQSVGPTEALLHPHTQNHTEPHPPADSVTPRRTWWRSGSTRFCKTTFNLKMVLTSPAPLVSPLSEFTEVNVEKFCLCRTSVWTELTFTHCDCWEKNFGPLTSELLHFLS